MPAFQKLQDHFGERLLVVAIAASDSKERVAQFAATRKISFPLLLDVSGSAQDAFQVGDALPVTFFLDPNGRIIDIPVPETGALGRRVDGAHGWDSLKVIRALEEIMSREPHSLVP